MGYTLNPDTCKCEANAADLQRTIMKAREALGQGILLLLWGPEDVKTVALFIKNLPFILMPVGQAGPVLL